MKWMFMDILKSSIVGFFLFLTVQLQAQIQDTGNPSNPAGVNENTDTINVTAAENGWLPTTSVYLELGGKVLYSLNVDFRQKENFAFSIGASYFQENSEPKKDEDSTLISQNMFFPSVMAYYLSGKRHRFELGGGFCAGFGSSQGLEAMAIYGNAGYRYQKKKGLIFRVCFTPFLAIPVSDDDNFAVIPWAGISLGYSF